MDNHPNVLLESWLPFDKVGAESLRDASAARKPPLNRLHVWWARRPLTVSRAAIVASLLPDYATVTADSAMKNCFPTEGNYHTWFLRLMGIFGDPVATRRCLLRARETGENLGPDPYGYSRAFTTNPKPEDLALLEDLLALTWDEDELSQFTVLDPFAGGGAIPFEARRYGFATVANELNPVAAVILEATLDYPARFGPNLAADIKSWGRIWAKRVRRKLASYYPKNEGESIFAYLWARTVACPVTGKPVPLSPNWWLVKKGTQVAVHLLTDSAWDEPHFEIVRGDAIDFDPSEGTISQGVGRSPWTGDTVDGDYIKAEAQDGRMGQMLYAVGFKRDSRLDFRSPSLEDLKAIGEAELEVVRKRSMWEAQETIPAELVGISNYDRGHRLYGVYAWADFFSPRQLLGTGVFVETLRELHKEIIAEMDTERAAAVETYLSLALDKAITYNSRYSRYDPNRGIRNAFERHNYAMKWSFAEFDASASLLPWCNKQVADAYSDMSKFLTVSQVSLGGQMVKIGPLKVRQSSASDLTVLSDNSVHAIVTDPPYYDNVMYAELADFFYVWLKRTVGHLYPEWFAAQLTDKDAEAVANPARFADLGRKKKKLAEQDYERKMAASFREMHRVLRDDGVLTVMFTHKRVEAWDTLATALIGAGFSVESSWPVHTESEHSLHQAKKNAARSTILLCCRKRDVRAQRAEPVWWDDIQGEVRETAREKAHEFAERGIEGVDLYLSTFGPVLAVISEHWPVLTSEVDERTGEPKPLRPETALDLAREEVIRLRKRGLLLGREVQFDPTTDWYLMAWDAFRAERFPADEARKLALALGLEMESDLVAHRVVGKKGSDVTLLPPKQRRARGRVNPEADTFDTWLDAVHTAMLVYEEDGAPACETFLKRAGLRNDGTFKACLQAMINAVPRTRIKGKFVRPEAKVLDSLRLAFFEELAVPAEEEPEAKPEQMRMEL
jgi:putative DNA methylase